LSRTKRTEDKGPFNRKSDTAQGSGLPVTRAGHLDIDWRNIGFWVAYFAGAIAISMGIVVIMMLITLGIH